MLSGDEDARSQSQESEVHTADFSGEFLFVV
jgi:hypothetical protein